MYTTKSTPNQDNQGFSLIELLVSLTIISTLLAISIPNYHRYITKTKILATLTELQPFKLVIAEQFLERGDLTHLDTASLHLPTAEEWKARCPWIQQAQVEQGHIQLLMSAKALGIHHQSLGDQLVLTLRHPFDVGNQQQHFHWQCKIHAQSAPPNQQTLLRDYLPRACLQL